MQLLDGVDDKAHVVPKCETEVRILHETRRQKEVQPFAHGIYAIGLFRVKSLQGDRAQVFVFRSEEPRAGCGGVERMHRYQARVDVAFKKEDWFRRRRDVVVETFRDVECVGAGLVVQGPNMFIQVAEAERGPILCRCDITGAIKVR